MDKLYLYLALSDIEPVNRFETGDILLNRCAVPTESCQMRILTLFHNGYEEKHSVRVVVHATKCYYHTVKVDMRAYPDIFELVLSNAETTDPTLLSPNLWANKKKPAKMTCDFYTVNQAALTEFIKTVKKTDRYNQEPSYKRSDCIQVLTNLKF
jgi:hypothetical protein